MKSSMTKFAAAVDGVVVVVEGGSSLLLAGSQSTSGVELEVDDVAVLYDVVPAELAEFSGGLQKTYGRKFVNF
jgi:hypothetical protein